MIASLAEIKSLCQLTNTDYDSFINITMPIIEQSICDYCNDDFIDKKFEYITSSNFVFNDGIELTNIGIDLQAGDTVKFFGTHRNDYAYTITSLTNDKLMVSPTPTAENDIDESVIMARIQYPLAFKFIASQMIYHAIQKIPSGLKSESVDDHSMVFSDNIINGFPASIMSALNSYRRLYKDDKLLY
jgi:hypothetical protein